MFAAALKVGPDDRAGLVDPMADAACRFVDPELFFPSQGGGGSTAESRVMRAKSVCQACPVRRECLREAIRDGEQYGIWGGLTVQDRRALLKQVKAFRSLPAGVLVRLRRGEPADLRPQDLPAVAAVLLRCGWSEPRIRRTLGIDPSALRAALRTARRILWVTDLLGDGPRLLPDLNEVLASAELPQAA
jgi:WhiB family redox-sensing transcriptional regulator